MRSRNSDGSYSNYFFITNTHGDVVAVTDRDGNITNRYAYGPWGEATRISEQLPQPFRYGGYYYDQDAELYWLHARWYDPGTGRFLSRDPALPNPMKLCSLNKYIYTHDNPASATDPSGRYPCKQGIYRLAIYVDILADVYVQDDHNVGQVDEFVRQIGVRVAGFPSGHPSFEHRKPPWTFGKRGWNPYYAEDEDEAHHLAAFIVIGYEDYPLSSRQYETYFKSRGNKQDLRLGDVGRELGTNLRLTTRYRGDPIAGAPAGLTAHELGGEIVRRLSTGNCDEYPSGQAEPI
jgi:RHS repeat-associated protein